MSPLEYFLLLSFKGPQCFVHFDLYPLTLYIVVILKIFKKFNPIKFFINKLITFFHFS